MNASTTTLNDVLENSTSNIMDENNEANDEKLTLLEGKFHDVSEKYETLKSANGAMNVELNEAQQQLCEALKLLLNEKYRLLEEQELHKLALDKKNTQQVIDMSMQQVYSVAYFLFG